IAEQRKRIAEFELLREQQTQRQIAERKRQLTEENNQQCNTLKRTIGETVSSHLLIAERGAIEIQFSSIESLGREAHELNEAIMGLQSEWTTRMRDEERAQTMLNRDREEYHREVSSAEQLEIEETARAIDLAKRVREQKAT
ncbi:MAG: hypothetical protein KDA66_01535, partial [Planctomycetaceae bacterium]|nr:hypothetical protein [Planctomycetaceae bacterium]